MRALCNLVLHFMKFNSDRLFAKFRNDEKVGFRLSQTIAIFILHPKRLCFSLLENLFKLLLFANMSKESHA